MNEVEPLNPISRGVRYGLGPTPIKLGGGEAGEVDCSKKKQKKKKNNGCLASYNLYFWGPSPVPQLKTSQWGAAQALVCQANSLNYISLKMNFPKDFLSPHY